MTLYLISSKLYENLSKYCNNKNLIEELFNKKIKELNFEDVNEVNYFLDNYKNVSYDKNNLIKYIELLQFFRYTITENVIRYIFETYFFDVINNIIDNKIIEMIKIISSMWDFKSIINEYYESINIKSWTWTKNKLYNFSRIINITNLNLRYNENITNEMIKNMIQIQTLNLYDNNMITDDGLKDMIHMQNLNLTDNIMITDDGLKDMIHMQNLNLTDNIMITDNGIKNMIYIQDLNLRNNKMITDEGIKNMIRMQNLNPNKKITVEGIKNMIQIQNLNLNLNLHDNEMGWYKRLIKSVKKKIFMRGMNI
jgi:hypothetical protein